MKTAEKRIYVLTAAQWYALKTLADGPHSLAPVTATALKVRELAERASVEAPIRWQITETGQRVYARLSVGPFCCDCGRPVVFTRRVAVAGGLSQCEGCLTKERNRGKREENDDVA